MNKQPHYYIKNGLSPTDAFEQGLLSKTELEGFYKGNIIKYLIRSNYKGNKTEDLEKAKDYLQRLINLENKHNVQK